eukprot:CAMPEP_0173388362 /NCGR_PEP_ID=MMETSP1356-20130122/10688_1 /TAXON_ID=77927 ORGANISM="Hemiselmis virescens, Strain PCC157" /NCGR_SAMPLE_ID=MMETSP1356 /ASSEMBLY_ACC=CAM_ASM_000847 /LENGTH=181 /DNA_ID=CAMNT_0014345251 /DNA_START=41 /DNA_END=586 /DNA_ORIENTATION=+
MVVVTYGTSAEESVRREPKGGLTAVKVGVTIMAGLCAAALVAAMVASQQETPAHFKSELVSYNKVRAMAGRRQRTTMLETEDMPESADGEAEDDPDTGGYECCWKAPNAKLASTSVASKVGPNGWGAKADADASVQHYQNVLGEVPEWVFKGTADHEWKGYKDVTDQDWYQNTYPAGEGGI